MGLSKHVTPFLEAAVAKDLLPQGQYNSPTPPSFDLGQLRAAGARTKNLDQDQFCIRLTRYEGTRANGFTRSIVMIKPSRGRKTPKLAKRECHAQDADLLFCCMDMLQIDRSRLMRDEPLLYRELQGVCTLCPNKQDCSFDLASGFDGVRWDEWWLYCPNSAMLTAIGALQKCRHPPHYNSASAFSRLQLPKE
jgi:hypothetical protein